MTADALPSRPLGKSGLRVSAIGVGTNRWRQGVNDQAALETYKACLDSGVNFFDTAEIYGFGKSERLIGDCRRQDARGATIASKYAPAPGRASGRHLLAALDASLARLGLETLDLYYVHFPLPFADLNRLADAMAEAVKAGKIRAVGVSNFSGTQMRRFAERLGRANVPLAANQVNYSLSNRRAEADGVLDACRALEVALVAYFPLASGRLTGPVGGDPRRTELLRALTAASDAHQGTPAQAALNWLLARDPRVIPIPGASKAANARQNAAALGWTLTGAEFAAIDKASAPWA